MRLLAVTVKHFRMHEELTVTFDRSRTLVAGPNESGKTTLVEAIRRVLFHPHRSATDLEKIRPQVGGGTPEVTLRFERSGRTFTLRKVFKKAQATAELTDETVGKRFAGDEAEAELRSLLAVGEGPLRQVLRGWSHLWVSQGESAADPTASDALDTAAAQRLSARLQSLSGTTLTESNADGATYRRIADEYDKTYSSKGIKAGSPLATALADLDAARDAATRAAGILAEFEDAADTVVREEEAIRVHRQTRADAEQHLATTQATLVRIQHLEQSLDRARREWTAAQDAYAQLRDADATIADISKILEDSRKSFVSTHEEIARLRSHEQRMHDDVSRSSHATTGAFAALQTCAATQDLLATIEKLFALETQRSDHEGKHAAVSALADAVAALDKKLREMPEVDRATLSALEDLDRRRQVATAKRDAIATRLEVVRADEPTTLDGSPLSPGDARMLTDAGDLRIGEGTTIRIIPGGEQSLAASRLEIAHLESQLNARLTELGVDGVAAARACHESLQASAAERGQLRERMQSLGGEDVKTRLTEVNAAIEKAEADIARKTPPGFVRPADGAALGAAMQRADEERRHAEQAVQRAKAAYDAAVTNADAARSAREDAERKAAEQRAEFQGLEIRKAALEQTHGTDREAELQKRAGRKRQAEEAVQETARAMADLAPDLTRSDKDRFERAVEQSAQDIVQAELRLAGARALLGKTGSHDLHGTKAAAEARLAVATRRHAELLRRAEAVRRLRTLFDARRQAVAELVATPLRKKVAEYLDALYGPGCRFSITKSGDTFADLQVARPAIGGLDFAFDSLSGGTREQVAAACRLAMAELLAGGEAGGTGAEERCLPMVFDDAFVNSDPERIKAIHRVLELGALRGLQIIVLSCTPHEYAFFAASRFDMPKPAWASSSAGVPAGQDDERPGIVEAVQRRESTARRAGGTGFDDTTKPAPDRKDG